MFEFLTSNIPVIIGGVICIVVSLSLYLIYIFSYKERSFEDAIADQRKRDKEEEMQQKNEKVKKDKEKKYKKWGKRSKEKSEQSPVQPPKILEPQIELIAETSDEIEIIEPTEIVVPKKKKATAQKPHITPPSQPLTTKSNSSTATTVGVSTDKVVTTATVHPPPEVEKRGKANNVSSKDKEKSKEGSPVSDVQKSQTVEVEKSAENVAPVQTNKKKKKVEQSDKTSDVGFISAAKLISLIKEAALDDGESQMLIDILLNKQKEASGWTKTGSKPKASEKELALEQEQKANLMTIAKLQQELDQERIRVASAQEKITLEKSVSHRTKQNLDILNGEKMTLLSKIRQIEKSSEEKLEAAVKKITEEKDALTKTIKQLESSSELETTKKSYQELQKVHGILVEQHNQIADTHKREIANLNAEVNKLKVAHGESIDRNSKTSKELEKYVKACDELLLGKKKLEQEAVGADASVKTEVVQLKVLLDDSKALCGDLEAQAKNLSEQVTELSKQNTKISVDLGKVQTENSKLLEELAKATEKNVASSQDSLQHNGEINGKAKDVEKEIIENQEKILKEKENALKQLYDDLSTCKTKITSLDEELEQQKQKNNDLREKNWKAMEALTTAEKAAQQKILEADKAAQKKILEADKAAQQKILEADKAADDKCKQIQLEANENLRLAGEKSVSQSSQNELLERLKKTEESLQMARADCNSQGEESNRLACEVKHLQSNQSLLESKFKDSLKTAESLKSEVEASYSNNRSCLQRIFPKLSVDNTLPQEEWLSEFEKQAAELIEKSSQSSDDKLLARFANEKDDLLMKLSNYEAVLAETESMLNRLQESAKGQESVWKEQLQSKEAEFQELNAKLESVQSNIEANSSETSSLQQRLEEENQNYINLKQQIEGKDKTIEDLQKEVASFDRTRKELEDVKSTLEKEKKTSKEFAAQMVRLNSLVKIGQDALNAEQENSKKLASQLQDAKLATTANGTSSPTIAENNESSKKPLKPEKSKKSKSSDASVKK